MLRHDLLFLIKLIKNFVESHQVKVAFMFVKGMYLRA